MLQYPSSNRGGFGRTWAAAAFCAALLAAAPLGAQTQPNVVMIMADDLDVDVWNTGRSLGYLPQIEQVINTGTTFVNTFAALPLCCPSRATYFTGQYPHNHRVIRNGGPAGGFQAFGGDDNTLATWMQGAGYRTGLIGKYLNGYALDNGGIYIPPGWDNWQALPLFDQFGYDLFDNNTVRRYGSAPADYQTDVVARLAQDFIRKADPRPFFLTLTPTVPHFEGGSDDGGLGIRPAPRHAATPPLNPVPPESAAAYNEADMRDKPGWMRSAPLINSTVMRSSYNDKVAAMRAFDDLVGEVLAALRDIGELGNTLIVITSDNGYQYGTHRLTGKTVLYEESIRLPMVISAPGQTVPRSTGEWAMNTDWAATIVDYAGAAPGRLLDGRSLRGLVEGDIAAAGRQTMLIEMPSDTRTRRYPPYLAVRSRDPALTLDATGLKVLVYAQTYDRLGRTVVAEELYDLEEDPAQLKSLHKSKTPDRLTQKSNLAGRMMELKTCVGTQCSVLED
jgi:N-acetylglucosamine-6-sulfatase